MHKQKKLGIMTVDEVLARADVLDAKFFKMQDQLKESAEEYNWRHYDDTCSEETLDALGKKIHGLRRRIQECVVEIQAIERGLSLIEMIEDGIEVPVN